MANFFKKLKSRTRAVANRMEKAQEAITFAEAGHPLGPVVDPPVREAAGARKLLVVGHESAFSTGVVDYAIEMAQRMSYEIVALNTAPLSCDTIKIFSSSQKKLCQEFKTMSEQQAEQFRTVAENAGLAFTHVVKFSDHDEALTEIQREIPNIEFVISDSRPETVAERAEERPQASDQIYVYAMI